MSAHTPGPWIAESPYFSEVQTMDRDSVASCWHEGCEGKSITIRGVISCSAEESAANARLIAAAPELLEALIRLEAELVEDKYGECYEPSPFENLALARAAIAKATGGAA